jgi:hypothetical protein
LFLVVEVTALFVTAYILLLVGIAMLCIGNLLLLESMKSYPWFASFPITIWRYLITQIIVSVIFVVSEQVFDRALLSAEGFALIHVAILAFYLVFLLMQKAGKEIIDGVEAKVKEKYINLRSMQTDVEALVGRVPEQASELQAVAEALRYSTPMSSEAILPLEEKIADSVIMLEQAADNNNAERISELCVTLLRQIKDRNNKAKVLK